MAEAEAAAAAADVDEVVISDPASVAQALSSVVNLAQQCLASIEEAYEFYSPFQKNTVMCLAIRRNLLNLVDTLKIVRFLSRTVDGLLTDLADSLALCADFLREYCPSNGADEDRFIGDEEEEEVVNKLAFMNKLLHLNQHSINIRLLIEAPEHARIAEKDPKPEKPEQPSFGGVKAPATPQKGAPTDDAKTPATVQRLKPSDSSAPRLSVSPSGQIKGGDNDRDRVILSHTLEQALAEVQSKIQIQSPSPTPHLSAVNQYRPHRSQYVYGPIHAPSYFLSASRAKEFAELVHHVKKIPANAPCVIIITGPQGVGKTSYAKYIAQKLHAFMDYHVFLPCYVPETGGKDQAAAPSPHHRQSVAADQSKEKDRNRRRQLDSESLMRACLSPSQLECLSANEVDKAFKDLVWAKKGVLLLDDVQSEDQIASLIPVTPPNAPRPAQCLLIITSSKPMNRLTEKLRLAGSSSRDPSLSSTYYYTQALEALPTEIATRVLQGGRTHAANEEDPSLLSDRQAVVLSSLGDSYPLVLDLIYHQLTLSSDPNSVVKQLTAAPSAEEKKMFQNTMVHVAQDLQHIFFYAYSHVPPASQSFFARLFIFPGTFDIAAVMSIFKLDLAAVKERLRPLLQCGLVMEHEVSSVSRRKAQQAKKMIEAQKTLDRNEAKSAKDTFAGIQQGQPIEPVSRYFVHELLRDFSFLVACKTENVSQLFVAFSTYYAEALKKVDNFLSSDSKANQAEAFRLYDADSHNYRAAIQEALNRSLEVPTASVLLCPRSLYAARLSAKRRVEMYSTYIELDGVKSLRSLGHCASLCAIADAHTALSEFEKAIPYYKQAQKLAEHLNSPAHVAAAFRGLAHISEGLGEHQIAIDYCLKCQTMLARLEQNNSALSKNVKASLCDLLLYMSTLHVALGAFQNGVDLLKECRRINDQHVKDPSTTARVLYALGELHTRLGEWETAVELLRDSALEAQKNYDWRTLARAYRMLDRAHESMGRFYKANCYREKLTQLIQLSDLPLH